MSAMARLGDVEVKCKEHSTQVCAVPPLALPNCTVHGQRRGQRGVAMRVSLRQMWFDLLMVRIAEEKINQ